MKRSRLVALAGLLLNRLQPCSAYHQTFLTSRSVKCASAPDHQSYTVSHPRQQASATTLKKSPGRGYKRQRRDTFAAKQQDDRRDFLIKGLASLAAVASVSQLPGASSAVDVDVESDLMWSPFFSEFPVEDELPYPPQFVAYLARFLLHYDDGCKNYYRGKVDSGGDTNEARWGAFASLAASVEYGLHRYEGRKGVKALLAALRERYMSEQDSYRQLALLFSLLPANVQPVEEIKQLLSDASGDALKYTTNPAVASKVVVSGDFVSDPTLLLPITSVPLYSKAEKGFSVPSLALHYANARIQTQEVTFGPLVAKERPLTARDFGLFAVCGALGCSVTHSAVIPLDVVKTRLQTSPGRYTGLIQGVTTIVKEEGPMMLLQGSGATLAGYFWYGITVYPGYEFFKRLFLAAVGPVMAEAARVPLVLLAGACATVIACFGVCPAEAIRIRQVADPGVGGFRQAAGRIIADDGIGKLYEGFAPILVRQVSFGMMKFFIFDFFSEAVFRLWPFLADTTSSQLSVSLVSGLVAGVCSAIVSQPADTVLSAMNKKQGKASILGTASGIINEYGPAGLFLGLGGRCLWSGMIISGQFLIYDLTKSMMHVSAADLKVVLDVLGSTLGTQ